MIARAAKRTCATLSAAAFSMAAAGADWQFTPSVEAGYLYDDNFRLSAPGAEIDVQGALLDARLEMINVMPASEFSFTPRVRATYFPDQRDVDTTDYFGTFNWEHRGQRLTSGVQADFAQQDVVNSEQPDAEVDSGLGTPVLGDSGRVLVRNRRTRASVAPSLDFELSARRALQFQASYTDVSFDREIDLAQVSYNSADLTAGLVSRITELSSLTTRLRGARYDIDTQGVSNSYGAELQWDTRNAADTRKFLRVGAQNVELINGGSETAWLAGAGVSFNLGRNELFADLARSVGPSAAGVVVARDQLRLRWTRAMTPRLSVLAGLRGTHDDDVNRDSDFEARTYATGDVGLQWRWQEEFSLRLAYDYTWQEFEDANFDATSNGATITFLYQPLQRVRVRKD
ncbi:MAG TPA: hypothetical protein VK624_01330 [Steroidobacteraceae bacterium]|nr:hypothetical protein [Steroidobacteraceae bacterium]